MFIIYYKEFYVLSFNGELIFSTCNIYSEH